jgi:integrase/recombinase XerD
MPLEWWPRPTPTCSSSGSGRDAAESTTKAYAGALALYLGWYARTGQPWASAERLGWFMTWLQHTPADPARPVVIGPGVRPVRRERR